MKFKFFGVLICFCASFFAINYWSQASFDIVKKEHRSLLEQVTTKRAIQIEHNLKQATANQQWLAYELINNRNQVKFLIPRAQYIVDNVPEIKQIAISPNNVTTFTVPSRPELHGNTILPPSQRGTSQTTAEEFYDAPYNYQGQTVFTKHEPVVIDDTIWGYISYTLDLDFIFAKSSLEDLNSQPFNFQLLHVNSQNRETILVQSKQPLTQQIYMASINLPNVNILLKLSPASESYASTILMNIVFSLSVASIFTLVCYLGFTEPNRLRRRLKKTQRKLGNLQLITQSIVDNVSDEVVFSDANGQVVLHNNKALANGHIPANILFKNNKAIASNSLFEADGKTSIEPTQHPINRALFNGESIKEEVVLISEEHFATHLELTSFTVKHSHHTIGAVCIAQQLRDDSPSLIGDLSHSTVLEMLEQDKSLAEVFEQIINQVQNILPEITVAISLADPKCQHISEVFSVDLPSFYLEEIKGTVIDERLMSSNSAISQNKMIVVEDIELHPYWISNKEGASQAGVRACWSHPIKNSDGLATGTVDFYSATVLEVKPATILALKETAHLAELALGRHSDIYRLNRVSLAVQHTNSVVIIVDPQGVIEYVNPKYTQVSGFQAVDVVGTLSPLFDTNRDKNNVNKEIILAIEQGESWEGEISSKAKSSQDYWADTTVTPILDDNKQVSQIVISQENISYKAANKIGAKVYHKSTDMLTGLLTQHAFVKYLDELLLSSDNKNRLHCLCNLEIDQYKEIFKNHGNIASDELLRQIGQLLSQTLRRRDTVARLNAEQFVILMEDCHWQPASKSLEKITERLSSFRFVWHQKSFAISISIGIVEVSGTQVNNEIYLQQAAKACTKAKEGNDKITLYQREQEEKGTSKGDLYWSQKVRHALAQDSFLLSLQPINSLNENGSPAYYDVILQLPVDSDFVLPKVFLPAASRYNLNAAIDKWTIEHTLTWICRNKSKALPKCSISLCTETVCDHSFGLYLLKLIDREPQLFTNLIFEFSEKLYTNHTASCQKLVATLSSTGCQFIITDFGAGFSSFGLLRDANVNGIKVNHDLVQEIDSDPLSKLLVQSITHYASSLGLSIIAQISKETNTIEQLTEYGFTHSQRIEIESPITIDEINLSSGD